jgi:hypothetical protein
MWYPPPFHPPFKTIKNFLTVLWPIMFPWLVCSFSSYQLSVHKWLVSQRILMFRHENGRANFSANSVPTYSTSRRRIRNFLYSYSIDYVQHRITETSLPLRDVRACVIRLVQLESIERGVGTTEIICCCH